MQLIKSILFWGLIFAIPVLSTAQKKRAAFDFNAFSGDLPVDDPVGNSVLHGTETGAEKINRNIFVKTVISSPVVFAGEPLLLQVKLFTRLNSDSKITSRPSLEGVTITAKGFNNDDVIYEKFNGKKYRVFIIEKLLLVPFKEGSLQIGPFSVSNDVSYEIPGHPSIHYYGTVSSHPIPLIVQALPAANRPAGFGGLVGKFTLQAAVKDSAIIAGNTDTLRVIIKGTGNPGAIDQPVINWPAGIEGFAAKESVAIIDSLLPLSGQKTFDIPFVAKQPGHFILPPIQCSFFNPFTKAYETVTAAELRLQVAAAPANAPSPGGQVGKPVSRTLQNSMLLLILILLTAIALYLVWKNKQEKKMPPAAEAPAPIVADAPGVQEPAMTVGGLEAIDDPARFLEQCKLILTNFAARETGLAETQSATILEVLKKQDPLLHGQVAGLLEQCDFYIYAPGTFDQKTRSQLLNSLRLLLTPDQTGPAI